MMKAATWAVSGASAPRCLRLALSREARTLRQVHRSSAVWGIGMSFRGPLVGEELIAVLSGRLADALRTWMPESTPPIVERAHQGRATLSRGPEELRTGRASQEPLGANGARAWPPTPAGRDAAHPAPLGRGVDRTPPTAPSSAANSPAALARARWWNDADEPSSIDRADHNTPELGAAALPAESSSALASAIHRYWRAIERSAQSGRLPSTRSHDDVPRAVETRMTGAPESKPRRHMAIDDVEPPPSVRAIAELPVLAERNGERPWWSASVEAVHARDGRHGVVAPPPREPTRTPIDDLAFADTLAEVLQAQARQHGVAVL